MDGKRIGRLISVVVVAALLVLSLAGVAFAGMGPAPNSGDGVPDGSGFEAPNGQGVFGAPNAGDGIPDGSGW